MIERFNGGEIAIELEGLLREAQDEQADIRRLEDVVAKVMTQAAFKEFPVLEKMSAKQILEFGHAVSGLSTDFAMCAASLAFAAEKENV